MGLAQAWFGICLVLNLMWTWVVCHLIYILPFSKHQKEALSVQTISLAFYLTILFSPQIQIKYKDDIPLDWKPVVEARKKGPVIIMINHQSFFDSLLYVAMSPGVTLGRCRTFMKSTLLDIPLFGAISRMCGHFPVYFASDETGKFGVDKEKMKPVMARMNEHMDNKGIISMFPEGQMNKAPGQLQSFRRGSFAVALERKCTLFQFVMHGAEISWPRTATIGGAPSTVTISLSKVLDSADYKEEWTNTELSEFCQKNMQNEVDILYNNKKTS